MFALRVGQWGAQVPQGFLTPADIPALKEAELVLWHNWVTSQNKIASVDLQSSTINVTGVAGDPFFGAGGTFRFALQNVANPAALAPGSFYVSQSTLFYRPVSQTAPASGALIVEVLPEAVTMIGESSSPLWGVSLVNLTVAHTAADLEHMCMSSGCGGQSCAEASRAGVRVANATDCHLVGVEVKGTGSYGVWFSDATVNCSIRESWLHDLGMGGVRIGTTVNTGSTATAPTHNVSVLDSEIEDGGHVVPSGTGVLAEEGYAHTILHNHIHHLFYTGVSTGWTWGYALSSDAGHTVGWNHIHDIFQRELSDGGCIYNLGRSPATLIINNLCHDVDAYGYGGWGLYTDEGSSNVTLRDNIVYHTKDASFHQHYGTDNVITNNIFAYPSTKYCSPTPEGQCDKCALRSSQHMDCWSPKPPPTDYGCNSSFTFQGNILLLDRQEVSGNATVTPFFTFAAYDHPQENGLRNMTWGRNLYWSTALGDPLNDLVFGYLPYLPLTFAEWSREYKDNGAAVSDPKFADAPGLNFTLETDSPALAMGFQQIDMSNVGPRTPFRSKVSER